MLCHITTLVSRLFDNYISYILFREWNCIMERISKDVINSLMELSIMDDQIIIMNAWMNGNEKVLVIVEKLYREN